MEQQSSRPKRLSRADLDRLLGGEDSEEVHALLDEWRTSATAGDDPLVTLAGALNATFALPPRSREEILRRAARILGTESRATSGLGLGVSKGWNLGRGGFKGQTLRHGTWYTALGALAATLILLTTWFSTGHRAKSLPSVTTYVTRNGQRAEVRLADGSTVILNVASRLDVPNDYVAGNRTLSLRGEALFTVQHHAGQPVTVIAGGVSTQVLGTTFLVRRYATDTATAVVVRDGKVAVGSAILTARQQMVVGAQGHGRIMPADPATLAFAAGTLELHMVPLGTAVAELDRWFDADIRIADSALAAEQVDAAFAAGSLSDLKNILELTFDVRVVRNGRVLTLYPKG